MHDPKLPGLRAQAKREGWDHFLRTAADERALLEGCTFRFDYAEHPKLFFETFLRHSKGAQFAGKPFELQPWQYDELIAPLFGWVRPDGTRRFRRSYVEIPKKNGKTTLASGIALYMLLADGEPGGEVYSAACDRSQARFVFDEALAMVEASPDLAKRVKPVPSQTRLVVPSTRSFYKALSADAKTKEGLNWHALICDEVHAWPNRDLWDTLRYGCAARMQPLLFAITTAGYDRQSICWELHQYAEDLLAGTIDDWTFFPLIKAAGPDDDWTKPETWHKANPSLGITINLDEFAADCAEAQQVPTKENSFKRYRLDIWTEQDVRLIQMPLWRACRPRLPPEQLAGEPCFGGLDLASINDIAAFAMAFRRFNLDEEPTGGVDVLFRFWVPEDNARQRERRDKVPYSTWIRQGLITATPGNRIDFGVIRNDIIDLGEQYNIREIAYDRWNAAQIVTELENEGFTMVPMGQGFGSMSNPTKAMLTLILGGELHHGDNAVATWMASNVAGAEDDHENIKPSKKKSREKIDGIVAMIMALDRLNRNAAGDGGSFYDDHELESF